VINLCSSAQDQDEKGSLTGTRTTTKPVLTSVAAVEFRPGIDMVMSRSPAWGVPCLCVPITSPTSCQQAIFVDQATDLSPSSDAVQVEVDRLG
jgi:hypothetical protein